MARGLKFQTRMKRDCTIYVVINKGDDELHGYCTALILSASLFTQMQKVRFSNDAAHIVKVTID